MLQADWRVGPLQGRRRRRHSRTGRFPATACRRTSRAAPATTRRGSTASGPTTTSRTWTGWRASSRRPAQHVPQPVVEQDPQARRSASSATARRTGRSPRAAISCARRPDVETSYFRLRGVSVHRRTGGVHRRARARLRHRAEPRRADAAADEAGADARAAWRSCAASCTTTACRSTRAASPTSVLAQEGHARGDEDGRAHRRAVAMLGGE